MTTRSMVFDTARRGFLLLTLAFFLLPFLWLAMTAYKPSNEIFSIPPHLFFAPTLDQFRNALRIFDVGSLITSSLLIAGGSMLLSLILGVPAGYALARSTHPAAMGVAYFFMTIRMVPAVAALIPFYLLMRDIGLIGSWFSVVLINCVLNTAFVSWMMFSYFRGLPKELEEAALTDGCGQFGATYAGGTTCQRPSGLRTAATERRTGAVRMALDCLGSENRQPRDPRRFRSAAQWLPVGQHHQRRGGGCGAQAVHVQHAVER